MALFQAHRLLPKSSPCCPSPVHAAQGPAGIGEGLAVTAPERVLKSSERDGGGAEPWTKPVLAYGPPKRGLPSHLLTVIKHTQHELHHGDPLQGHHLHHSPCKADALSPVNTDAPHQLLAAPPAPPHLLSMNLTTLGTSGALPVGQW